jgi:2-keto-4-pentenoate hydratase
MEAQLARRAQRLSGGEEHLGWKVGFGTPPVMERLGTSASLVGFLVRSAVVESGSTVSVGDWTKPILEPEIAVHVRGDVRAGADRDEVLGAIAGLSAAIELADLDPPPDDVEAMLADDLYQRAVLLGPVRPGADVADVRAVVRRNGEVEGSTDDPTAAVGNPLDVVAHVAATLEACGAGLEAGSVIITGSVVPALDVEPGDEVTVELEPLGTLTVGFTD